MNPLLDDDSAKVTEKTEVEEDEKVKEDEHNEKNEEPKDPMKDKHYQGEIAAGDNADLFSTNIHKMVPAKFPDFGRRFIAQYPYTEKSSSQIDDEAEERFDQAIKNALQEEKDNKQNDDDETLRPVKAPAYLVLAVAKHSAIMKGKKPVKPNEYIVDKKSLRSGDYWDSFWEEEITDPVQSLRTGEGSDELKTVKVKIMPGSKLYKLVSMAKDLSPKLLYVINDVENK
ncbi:hypothetical protein O0L34_g10290 [Tuta absoluta]|nr:hypothetical protein O0L34_g10290 [Tuta absoluta]